MQRTHAVLAPLASTLFLSPRKPQNSGRSMPQSSLVYLIAGKPGWTLASAHVFLCLCNEWREQVAQDSLPGIATRLLVVDVLKFILSVSFALWRTHVNYAGYRQSHRQSLTPCEDEETLTEGAGDALIRLQQSQAHGSRRDNSHIVLRSPVFRTSIPYIILTSVLFGYYKYNNSIAQQITDPFTQYLTLSIATLITLIISCLARSFSILQWHAALLQFCGFLVMQASIALPLWPQSYRMLICSALSHSLSFVTMNYLYIAHGGNSWLGFPHAPLFACGILTHCAVLLAEQVDPTSISLLRPLEDLSHVEFMPCLIQAVLDLSSLGVTFYWGATAEGVLSSTGRALGVLVLGSLAANATVSVVAGCFLVISASIIFMSNQPDAEEEHRYGKRLAIPYRRVVSGALLLIGIIYLALNVREWPLVRHFPIQPASVADVLAASTSCVRKPLPSLSYWPFERTYHVFDNVLLVVFFSHARYDANLDYYREVYSQFFPNIVFVGPGSREDAGFAHSYDVLVDSYQSDEDLVDQKLYKMAGRMAHHMLYTAMREHDCYDGYLWAPFDTLLNIPRLQSFDQQYFWYHSPFGQYVPNTALGDAETNANKSLHAPAALISPDPALNLTETWRGWGVDWWWGDPNVGLAVCMQAFNRVPPAPRERLETYTNGTTRLIGGSADTLYIPGRHRQMFMDTLALFLETDCFLEIATPTVVHLVAPPEEPILFVDHWWIWQPPFNATFVRQMWARGVEVDTFHTFHWGDQGADGIWQGNPGHIRDVRLLFAESARRQGIEFPAPPEQNVSEPQGR